MAEIYRDTVGLSQWLEIIDDCPKLAQALLPP
jgi:hypothetical protein